MPNITIRNVPPDVHAVLSDRAATAGQSLQQYLLGELTAQALRPTMEEVLERIEARLGAPDDEREPVDIVALIHEQRAERDRRIAGR